jgi:hypothetical protein
VARQSPGRRNADDPDANEVGDLDILDDEAPDDTAPDDTDPDAEADDDEPDEDVEDDDARDPVTEALWADVGIDPVEIALPTGSGYTLRAYRSADELTPTETDDEDEDDPFEALNRRPMVDEDDDTVVFDDDLAEQVTDRRAGNRRHRDDDEEDEDSGDDAVDHEAPADEAEEADEEAEDDEAEEEAEDVPVFLSHRGKLLVFRTPESLVEFVRSGAEHDLAQLATWPDLVERLRPEDVEPVAEDSYELDLVVDNLRGGHDVWDPDLIIKAGELARDIGYALRMDAVLTALAPGSPLDDLDEAMRGGVAGGVGGFFARRRLRKIGAQQATLGWRTIIGKISGAVVWRE